MNPYEAPQSELQPPLAHEPRDDADRSIRLLIALQFVLVIAILGCFIIGVDPFNWVWRFLWTLSLGLTLNSMLLALLAWRNRAWTLLLFGSLSLVVSGLILYAMVNTQAMT